MQQSKIYTERLKRFAKYLTTQDLVAKDFFAPSLKLGMQIDDGDIIPVNPILFMAMFELPHIFPKEWAYNNRFEPILKKRKNSDSFESVREWFGITDLQMEHLFFQDMQMCECFGGKIIDMQSTQHDLAFNVLELVSAMQNEKTEFIICLN